MWRMQRQRASAVIVALVTASAFGVGTTLSIWTSAGAAMDMQSHARNESHMVTVANPMIPLPTNNSEAAAYLTVRNRGKKPVAIVKASVPSTVAQMAMPMKEVLHGQTETMVNVPRIVVPAHKRFRLAPGDYHIMIEGLQTTLAVGQRVPLTLTLNNGSTVSFSAPVVPLSKAFGKGGVAPSPSGGGNGKSNGSGGMKGMPGMKGMSGMKGMG